MKLYSRKNHPTRVRYVDPRTCRVLYNTTTILHPEEPTEVPKDLAEKLIKQNPHLIATKPYSELPDEEKFTDTPYGFPSREEMEKQRLKEVFESKERAITDGSLRKKEPVTGSLPTDIPKEPTETLEQEKETGEDFKKYIPILEEIADIGEESLTLQQVREYGAKLGIKIPVNKKAEVQRQILNERRIEILDAIEGELAQYDVEPGDPVDE